MTQLNSLDPDLQWIKQVRGLLIEVARASLSDIPKFPKQVMTDALPLAEQAKMIQQKASQPDRHSIWQHQQQDWLEEVRQLLVELSRISLSESPKLPEDIAQQTLTLVETAQDLQETLENPNLTDGNRTGVTITALDQQLDQVRVELQTEQATSTNPEAPQWNQILALLDQAQHLYHQVSTQP